MGPANGVKETTRVTAPVASNTLSVNVFTAPGKAMVGERPKPFGEAFGFDPITSTLIFGEHDAVLVDAIVQSDPMRESLGLSHRCFLQPIEVLQVTRWPVRAHFGGNRGHETVGTGNSGDRRNVPQFQ